MNEFNIVKTAVHYVARHMLLSSVNNLTVTTISIQPCRLSMAETIRPCKSRAVNGLQPLFIVLNRSCDSFLNERLQFCLSVLPSKTAERSSCFWTYSHCVARKFTSLPPPQKIIVYSIYLIRTQSFSAASSCRYDSYTDFIIFLL